jgi:deoxyribonuclease-1
MRFFVISVLLLVSGSSLGSPSSFNQAKKVALNIFSQNPITLYCHCRYEQNKVNLTSCNMKEAEQYKRAHRIEWEHIMAAEHFGRQFDCWRAPLCKRSNGKPFKGRSCCQKIDAHYRHIEAELYNLWPEVGLVNQARSNYRFGMLSQQSNYYGCHMTINKYLRRAEPPDDTKGLIARAYLFMAEHYSISMSKSQRQLFNAWNRQYAPTLWERQWAKEIALIEGYDNEFITHWSTKRGLS